MSVSLGMKCHISCRTRSIKTRIETCFYFYFYVPFVHVAEPDLLKQGLKHSYNDLPSSSIMRCRTRSIKTRIETRTDTTFPVFYCASCRTRSIKTRIETRLLYWMRPLPHSCRTRSIKTRIETLPLLLLLINFSRCRTRSIKTRIETTTRHVFWDVFLPVAEPDLLKQGLKRSVPCIEYQLCCMLQNPIY